MRILAAIILFAVLFVSAGPVTPVRAQIIYQPPVSGQLVPVTGPNCPSIPIAGGPALQTAPWAYTYGVCTYYGARANVTVPPGMALEWRYYVQGPWWWPFQQEQTAIAYAGQSVSSDFLRLYYAPYVAYVPGQPIFYPPPGQWPPPSTQPPYPTWPWPGMPQPSLPAPGAPAPPRTESGVGLTIGYGQGWQVAGYRLQYASGRVVWQCHTYSTPESGWVTDGVISPNAGDIARAPTPCP